MNKFLTKFVLQMERAVLTFLVLFEYFVIGECAILENSTNVNQCPNLKIDLRNIRKRRYLAFPDNSNVVMTLSLVKAFMTHAPAGWNTVIEIDVLFPLPDHKTTSMFYRGKLHHHQKRDVWERMKGALDFHNINGRACILRSICEAREYLAPPGRSLVHDILRAIFTAPTHDDEFMDHLGDSYEELHDPNFCAKAPDCPVSLLHFLLHLNKQKY